MGGGSIGKGGEKVMEYNNHVENYKNALLKKLLKKRERE